MFTRQTCDPETLGSQETAAAVVDLTAAGRPDRAPWSFAFTAGSFLRSARPVVGGGVWGWWFVEPPPVNAAH